MQCGAVKRPKYGWVVACLVFAFVLIFVIVNCEWFFWADFIVCMLDDVPGWRYRSWISLSYWYLGNDVDTKWIRQTRMLSTMSTSDNWYILFTSCAYILIRYGCQRSIFISSGRPTAKLSTIQWEECIPTYRTEEGKNGREAPKSEDARKKFEVPVYLDRPLSFSTRIHLGLSRQGL